MATERLNILVTESGAAEVARAVSSVADAVGEAGSALQSLRKAIKDLKSGDTTRNMDAVGKKAKVLGTNSKETAKQLEKLGKRLDRVNMSSMQVASSSGSAGRQIGKLKSQLGGAAPAGARAATGIAAAGAAAGSAAPRFDRATKQLFILRSTMATFGGIAVAKGFLSLSDSFQNLTNRVRLVTDSTEDLIRTRTKLFGIARDTRQNAEATIETYVRLKKATAEYGTSAEDIQGVLTTINKMMAISGASATESSQAIRQLSQAFSKGKLDGDEFRSVSENMPDILDALSQSLGVSRGALRTMAEEGQLTSGVLLTAFREVSEEVDQKFAGSAQTLGQAWEGVKTSALEAVGAINEGLNPIGLLIGALNLLARNFWVVTGAVQILALWLGSKLVRAIGSSIMGIKALYAAHLPKLILRLRMANIYARMEGFRGATGVLKTFGNFVGKTALRVGALGLAAFAAHKGFSMFTDAINSPLQGLGKFTEKYAVMTAEIEKERQAPRYFEDIRLVADEATKSVMLLHTSMKLFSQEGGIKASSDAVDEWWESASGQEWWDELDASRQRLNQIREILDNPPQQRPGETWWQFSERRGDLGALQAESAELEKQIMLLEEQGEAGRNRFVAEDAQAKVKTFIAESFAGFKSVEGAIEAANKKYDEQLQKLVALQQQAGADGLSFDLFVGIEESLARQRDEVIKLSDPIENLLGPLRKQKAELEDTTGQVKAQNRELEVTKKLIKEIGEGRIAEEGAGGLPALVAEYIGLEDAIDAAKEAKKDAEKAAKKADKDAERRLKDRQRAAKAFANQLQSLENSLNPVLAAERKLAKNQMILNAAHRRGKIELAEYVDLTERLERSMKDSLNPMAATLRGLAEETASFSARSKQAAEFMELKKEVTGKLNRELTSLEELALKAANAMKNLAEKNRDSVDAFKEEVDELVGAKTALEEYARAKEVAAAALRDPRSSGKEEAIAEFRKAAFLKTQNKDVQELIQKYDKLQAARNAEKNDWEKLKVAYEAAKVLSDEFNLTLAERIRLTLKLAAIQAEEDKKKKEKVQEISAEKEANVSLKNALKGVEEQYFSVEAVQGQLTNTIGNMYLNMEDIMVNFFTNQENDWKAMVDGMLEDLTRLLARMAIMKALQGDFASAGIAAGGLGLGAIGKGLFARDGANWHVGADVPKFAHGGQFMVGGSGGPDTKLVQFMASPGERVNVSSPGQTRLDDRNRQQAPSAPPVINNIFDLSSMGAAFKSPAGQQAVVNTVKMKPEVFKKVLK